MDYLITHRRKTSEHSACLKRERVKEPDGPIDDDKGDRQQWVVDNREPADFQYGQYFHVLR